MKHPSKECGTNTCVHNALIILIHTCGVHALHSIGMGLNIFETTKPFHKIFVTISLYSSSMLSLLIRTTYIQSCVCALACCVARSHNQHSVYVCQSKRVEWNGYELAFCWYCRCLYFTYHKWTNRDTKFLCRKRRR